MISPALLRAIRSDVRAWPGNASLDADDAPEAFALLRAWVGHEPRAAALLAAAESPAWTRASADELLDLLADWLAEQAASSADGAHMRRVEAIATGRRGGEAKGARLTDAKKLALEYEARLSLPDHPAPPKLIADALSEAGARVTTPYRVGCDLADARQLLADSPSLRRHWAVELERRLLVPPTPQADAALARYRRLHACSTKAPIRAPKTHPNADSPDRHSTDRRAR